MSTPPTTSVCPLHETTIKQVDDHEGRLRAIEHCGPEDIPDHGVRLTAVEKAVDQLTVRIGTWAAAGMIIGGIAIQAFTRYVLGW